MRLADPPRVAALTPEDAPPVPRHPAERRHTRPRAWQGPTYYGRPQLKEAPFQNWVVGGYIFLAGLSGSSALLSTLARAAAPAESARTVRRGRWLSLLAPVLGSPLLIYDLHTPKRFYNMLRVAKGTSPMSIGTWILSGFTAAAFLSALAEPLARLTPRRRRLIRFADAAQIPAALSGAGLSTYTAALLSATSTPIWAAAPRALAARFGASSIASGAAALAIGQRGKTRRTLDAIAASALAAELAATLVSHSTYRRKGIADSFRSPWGWMEEAGAAGLGLIAPLAMYGMALAARRRSAVAPIATLIGSLMFRVSIMGVGDVSARDPDISFRFSQPENLRG